MSADAIERELLLTAPVESVWAALTEPDKLLQWFETETEIDLRPGGEVTFGEKDGTRFLGVIEAVEEPALLAYRWCLDKETPVDEGPTTRVEFRLTPVPGGTRLRLTESGFASLPGGLRDRHLAENTKGWRECLDGLSLYLAGEPSGRG